MKKVIFLMFLFCLTLTLLSACGGGETPSGGNGAVNTDNSTGQDTQTNADASQASESPADIQTIGSAKEFMRRVQKAGYLVEDKHAIKADGLVDGFVMLLPTDEGSWYIPVLEFDSEQTATAYVERFDQSITIAYTEGKFVFAMNVEPDLPISAEGE